MRIAHLSRTAAFAAVLLLTEPGFAQDNLTQDRPADNTITSQTTEVTTKPLTEEERTDQRYLAERLLQHVNYARVALAMKDDGLAREHLDHATSLNDALKDSAQEYRTKTRVLSGRFTYDYESTHKEHYFPLDTDLMTWRELGTGPYWADNKGIAVKDADLVYLSFTVDTDLTTQKLMESKNALNVGNRDEAQKILIELVDKTVELDKATEMPVQMARDNIALARYFLRAKNYPATRYALAHAEKGLAAAEKDPAYDKHSVRIIAVRDDIKKLDAALEKQDPTLLDKAENSLKGWWEKLKGDE